MGRIVSDCVDPYNLDENSGKDIPVLRLLHFVLGLVTEAAELADLLKKHIFYGRKLDVLKIIEELGDKQWYFAGAVDVVFSMLHDHDTLTLNAETPGELWAEMLKMNIAKLKERYPNKFDSERAIVRDAEAERKALLGVNENGVEDSQD